jgi:hypothetical protein
MFDFEFLSIVVKALSRTILCEIGVFFNIKASLHAQFHSCMILRIRETDIVKIDKNQDDRFQNSSSQVKIN